MDLVVRVRQAMVDHPVNPAEFERCACALLQPRYPGLSAVEGGHDFGRDADIYFPFGDGDPTRRGRLLVTTGDPAANLRTGLRRMSEEGVTVDLVVMACLRPISARGRATLDDICAEYGLQPPHVYARDHFVAQLVREPAWRQRLLGVAGELSTLLDRPLEMLEQATAEPALVGRDAELSELKELVESGSDSVVVGVPGVGKTRLTAELGDRVVFLERPEAGTIVDDLLTTQPAAVVVDDAHDRVDQLQILRRVRQQEGLSFAVIATTWPDQADEVVAALPGARTVVVGLLERADMNVLVKSVGVTGHRARTTILRQAEGRPGWALVLCELFVKGFGFDVANGTAHLANVERFLRQSTESAIALDVLACVAALGRVSPEVLHELAPLVGVPPAALTGLMGRLARNGLVEYTLSGWQLQHALRAPLIARWFFTDPPDRPWSTLVAAFPNRGVDLAEAVVAAAQVGPIAARRGADSWARSLPDSSSWDAATLTVVQAYSTLHEGAAQFATEHARKLLTGPRTPRQLAGINYDPVAAVAKRLLAQVARQWLLPEAVYGLLDLAVDDTRPRRQTPEHPLRVLTDMAIGIDPDFGSVIEIRERLLGCVLDWLTNDPNAPRWTTAAELIAAVFAVEVSGSWTDPGAPDTLTVTQGVDSAANLERLLVLWERVENLLDAAHQTDSPRYPPEALAMLVDLAGEWLRLGSGVVSGSTEPQDEQRQIGTRGGSMILETLRPALQRVPGLALRAQRLLDDLDWAEISQAAPPAFDVDPDLQDLCCPRGPRRVEGSEDELQSRRDAAEALARRLADLGPDNGVARFEELLRQARLAGIYPPGDWIADQMRPSMSDPGAWCEAAAREGSSSLLGAALVRCLEDEPTALTGGVLAAAMGDPNLRGAVVSVVLNGADMTETNAYVISELRTEDAPLLDLLVIRGVADDILYRLLVHPVPAIAGTAAINFAVGQKHGPALPENWRSEWRDAICGLRAEELDTHGSWRLGELLKYLAEQDPDISEEWFKRQLDEMDERGFLSAPQPHGCEHHLARLPQPHRERLARQCAGRRWIGRSMLTYLVGSDRDLAERLLGDKTLTENELLEAITGQRNERLEQIGPLLLARNVSPETIAAAAGFPPDWHWGKNPLCTSGHSNTSKTSPNGCPHCWQWPRQVVPSKSRYAKRPKFESGETAFAAGDRPWTR